MYQKNNNFKNSDKPKNKAVTAKIILDGKTDRGEAYDVNQVLDILEELISINAPHIISIPIYASRADMIGNDAKGSMVVGFLREINLNNDTFELSIYPKYADKFPGEVISKVRVNLDYKDKSVRQILGIDIFNAPIMNV